MYSLISLTLLLSVAEEEKEDELKIGQNVNVTSGVQWRLLMSRPKSTQTGYLHHSYENSLFWQRTKSTSFTFSVLLMLFWSLGINIRDMY